METKEHEIGETRRAKLLDIHHARIKGKPTLVLVLKDDLGEGHGIMGHPKGDFEVGQQGTLKFTKGGARGGYWHFTPDEEANDV